MEDLISKTFTYTCIYIYQFVGFLWSILLGVLEWGYKCLAIGARAFLFLSRKVDDTCFPTYASTNVII
jgi:hypothetical protein